MKYMEAQNTLAQNAKALMLDWSGTRKQIQFWLRLDKAFDLEVMGIIEWFKAKGLFRGSAMTGLRVMFAYYNNDVEGIKKELPNLESMMGQGCDEDLKAELATIKRMILEQNGNTIQPQTLIMKSATPPPKAEVKATQAASADDIADNFLNAFF